MTRRLHILIAGCAAAVAVAEWLHGNAGSWAWTAGVAGLATAGLAVVRGPRTIASGLAALASLLLGVVVVAGVREVRRIVCCWRAVITPFYVSLEAPRQTQAGGTAVGSVLIDAAPAARDRDGAVSALFARRHGVTLRFYTPHLAPVDSTVFDYTTPDGRTLFSVQPIPPSQGDAKLTALHRAAGRAGAALAAALLFLFMLAPPGRSRWLVVLAAAWCLMRAPLGSALGLASLFSSALFYRPMLGMFSASAGSLVVLGLVLALP